jgi:hypothetical protein
MNSENGEIVAGIRLCRSTGDFRRNIWLPGGGLLDEEYRPKPVYFTLEKLINQTWKTYINAQTDKQGRVTFRGFFGEYEVSFQGTNGMIRIFPIHVSKNEENNWVFIIDVNDQQ